DGECGAVELGCFDTIGFACTGEACGPDHPCPAFNVYCTPRCAPPTPGPTTTTTTLPSGPCSSDADCDDGNPCTFDACRDGVCVHECRCVSPGPDGGITCCPGPAATRSARSATSTTATSTACWTRCAACVSRPTGTRASPRGRARTWVSSSTTSARAPRSRPTVGTSTSTATRAWRSARSRRSSDGSTRSRARWRRSAPSSPGCGGGAEPYRSESQAGTSLGHRDRRGSDRRQLPRPRDQRMVHFLAPFGAVLL